MKRIFRENTRLVKRMLVSSSYSRGEGFSLVGQQSSSLFLSQFSNFKNIHASSTQRFFISSQSKEILESGIKPVRRTAQILSNSNHDVINNTTTTNASDVLPLQVNLIVDNHWKEQEKLIRVKNQYQNNKKENRTKFGNEKPNFKKNWNKFFVFLAGSAQVILNKTLAESVEPKKEDVTKALEELSQSILETYLEGGNVALKMLNFGVITDNEPKQKELFALLCTEQGVEESEKLDELFNQACKDNKFYPLFKSVLCLHLGNISKSMEHCEIFIKENPTNQVALRLNVKLLLSMKRIEDAMLCAEKLIELGDKKGYLLKIRCLDLLNRHEEIHNLCDSVLKTELETNIKAEIFIEKSKALMKLGIDGLSYLEKVTEELVGVSVAMYHKAIEERVFSFLSVGKIKDMMSLLEKYINKFPDLARPHVLKARILFSFGHDKDAMKELDIAQALDEEIIKKGQNMGFYVVNNKISDRYFLLKSFLYLQRGDYSKAHDFCDKAKDDNPYVATPAYMKAIILEKEKGISKKEENTLQKYIRGRWKANVKFFDINVRELFNSIIENNKKPRESDTRLMMAVRKCDLESVKKLIATGDDINAVNELGEDAIAIAAENRSWEILCELLRYRKQTSMKELQNLIDLCLIKYKSSLNDFEKEAALDMGVRYIINSRGTRHRNIEDIMRYMAHMIGSTVGYDLSYSVVEGGVEKLVPLTGYTEIETFLRSRIDVNFKILIDILADQTRLQFYTETFINRLKLEILSNIETYRVARDGMVVLKGARLVEKDVNGKLLPKEILIDEDKDPWFDKLVESHAENVTEKVLSLQEGEEYCCPSGHIRHAIYVSFLFKNGKFFSRSCLKNTFSSKSSLFQVVQNQ